MSWRKGLAWCVAEALTAGAGAQLHAEPLLAGSATSTGNSFIGGTAGGSRGSDKNDLPVGVTPHAPHQRGQQPDVRESSMK